MSPERDINRLPDELLIKIFQDYMLDLCRLSRVCKRFQKIVEDYLLWKSLYQKVYKYDQPLFHLESRKFQFESPDVSKYKNPWKESFKQLYRGVHVRPDFQNLTIGKHNVQCFDTIHEALSYVNNIEEDPSSQHLIFVHSGIHNVDDTIIIESNVALIGAATGSKHEIAKSVIINGYKQIIQVNRDLKRVYVGYMTLQISVTVEQILDCAIFLRIHKSTPIIEHCIFRRSNNNVQFPGNATVILVSGYGANPLVRNCDISVSRIGLAVYNMAQGIYEDNIFNNEIFGIYVANCASAIIRRNNIQNSYLGIYILKGTGYLENNNIHNNKTGIFICNLLPNVPENFIYDYKINKLYIDGGNSLIENNSIYDNAASGLVIGESYVTVRRNKIYHNNSGIYVQSRSNSVIEENKIYENYCRNVLIINGSWPTLKRNQIYGQQIGIQLDGKNYGILEENTIYSHLDSGIEIGNGSNPVIRKNTIRDNEIGLLVFSNSFDLIRQNLFCMPKEIRDSGRIEDNAIYNNALVGIKIMSNSDAIVRHNKIYRNGRGISVEGKSRGLIEENELYDNFSFNVWVTSKSEPILERNRIRDTQVGVYFDCADGKLKNNDIYDHTRSGVKISNGSNPEILDNRIRNNHEGVLVCDSGFGFLKQNYIFNSTSDNVKIINSEPIFEYNQIFQARNCGINIQEGGSILKQNYIFENNHAGVHIVATRSQSILKGNMIFCNGGIAGVEITGCSNATELKLNTIFYNRCDGLWSENGIPNRVAQSDNNIHNNNISRNG